MKNCVSKKLRISEKLCLKRKIFLYVCRLANVTGRIISGKTVLHNNTKKNTKKANYKDVRVRATEGLWLVITVKKLTAKRQKRNAITHTGCVCLVMTVVFKHLFETNVSWSGCPVCCCRNCDGFIDREEFGDILHMTGEAVTEEDIDEMFGESDTNKDGKIDFDGTTQMRINAA